MKTIAIDEGTWKKAKLIVIETGETLGALIDRLTTKEFQVVFEGTQETAVSQPSAQEQTNE